MDGTTRKKTIILVDDQIINLRISADVLSEKYKVFAVTSGKRLLLMLKKVMPDLILLDIDMPEMNGFETLKRIKENPETAHIPVIFLTARDDTDSKAEASALGASGFIRKPFSLSSLLKHIENCFKNQEVFRQ